MDAPASGPAAAGIRIILPDGSERTYAGTPTGAEISASIGRGLAKAALAIRVDGELRDLARPVEGDARIEIVTRDSAAGIELLRHDAAHVMAEAVKGLYPDAQVTIGPPIENGFYYDFYREQPFSSDDLAAIEARMREIVRADAPFTREEIERGAAIDLFRSRGEAFKAEIIQDLPPSQTITLYRQGDFFDLCRGPHSPSVGRVGQGFKLMRVAGAYWRGDSSKAQLQRLYGTAWADEKQLAAYLHQLEEAEKRDHRRLGRDLDLFHQQEEAVGAVFWHPKGWRLYRTIEEYLRVRLAEAGYQEVRTPQLLDRSLWERSGHWDKFHENMFIVSSKEDSDKDSRLLALKPMNCPGHIQIFRQGVKSYRDLPLRYSEFGSCHRNEPSGSLSGIMRVRAFTQDDAHIFCTEEQITAESKFFCDLLLSVYKDFGFESVRVKFSDRPERRAGSDAVWDRAEGALRTAIEAAGLPYTMNPGEGAFYGPKLEFVLSDAIGRDWQCGTLQVDFVLPERLDAEYTASDGSRRRPVMLHRAIFGSFERFIGILIENYAGRFPLWLAPLQVVVASIAEDAADYAAEVKQILAGRGLRVAVDNGAEKINYKVRMHSLAKVPVLLVVGRREREERTVTVRRLGIEAQESLALEQAAAILCNEAQTPSHKATAH